MIKKKINEMVSGKKRDIFRNNWMNCLAYFNLYIDIALIVYIFNAKIHFFFSWFEKIVKRGDAQGGI